MFGDNKVVTSSAIKFDEMNTADVLSTHTGYPGAWPLIRPLLFWRGHPAININKKKDAAVQVIGECQDLKKTQGNKTRRSSG
jgi:hypothetical protein